MNFSVDLSDQVYIQMKILIAQVEIGHWNKKGVATFLSFGTLITQAKNGNELGEIFKIFKYNKV